MLMIQSKFCYAIVTVSKALKLPACVNGLVDGRMSGAFGWLHMDIAAANLVFSRSTPPSK
jgi:hypothetical protein